MRASAAARLLRSPLAPALVALALALVYLLWEPRTVDLAAARYRSELFGREGLAIWNGGWYGGHHLLSYSVLAPPLGWLLGPPPTIALATVASAALFERVVRRHFGAERASWGALWFGAAAASQAFTNRLPFALGVALALGAVLALQRHRRVGAGVLALLCALASPVAGIFLALGGTARALGGRSRGAWLEGSLLAVAALGPVVVLALAFPQSGHALFPLSIVAPIPLLCAACLVLLPREERELRWAAALYGAGATVAFAVDTPMGSNAARLGALLAGPLLLCALPGRAPAPRAALAAGFLGLAVWQWSAPVRDVRIALTDPAADEGYFDPLRSKLAALPGAGRVEVLFTRSHWESQEIPSVRPLARGWVRQLDTELNPLFYEGTLTVGEYRRWLTENAVRYVAVPGAAPDFSSEAERELIDRGLPYLRPRWRSRDWRLYETVPPARVVVPDRRADIALEALGSDYVRVRVRRPGSALVRVRWTPYWLLEGGCVERDGDWTRVRASETGILRMTISLATARMLDGGRRCGGRDGR